MKITIESITRTFGIPLLKGIHGKCVL